MVGTSILVPQARLADRDRHANLDVIAVTPEHRMGFHAQRNIEIARRHPIVPALPFPATRTASRSGLRRDAHFDGFITQDAAVAVARGADTLQLARSRTAAGRSG